MPDPVDAINSEFFSPEEGFLDLLVETLESLDRPVRGQFLQRLFKSLAQVDLTDAVSLEYWNQTLVRRRELSESLGKAVSWWTAMVDVLASSNRLRVPILMEYAELKKLQINAATDPLTGLYNRRLFEEYFEKELNRARRYSHHLALIILDLHEFKEVNDRHGHQQGDLVLQAAASTLRKSMRTSDFAFRIGGDEFALLLPQSDPDQAATLGRRLRANFQAAVQPMRVDVPLGLDYGLAIYPQDGDQREVLTRVADERLYQLKHGQRLTPGVILPKARPAQEAPRATVVPEPAWAGTERRKWERVTLAGTRAYALVGEAEKAARVLDLSYGGVALETDSPDELAGTFHAVLHVPILPPVRVSLRRVDVLRGEGAASRVGCSFVS